MDFGRRETALGDGPRRFGKDDNCNRAAANTMHDPVVKVEVSAIVAAPVMHGVYQRNPMSFQLVEQYFKTFETR